MDECKPLVMGMNLKSLSRWELEQQGGDVYDQAFKAGPRAHIRSRWTST